MTHYADYIIQRIAAPVFPIHINSSKWHKGAPGTGQGAVAEATINQFSELLQLFGIEIKQDVDTGMTKW